MVRTKAEKPVIYEEWKKCSEYCTDAFWTKKFTEASVGTFPQGCTYNAGELSFWSNKNNDIIQLTISDIPSMIQDAAIFFEKNCSLKSPKTRNATKPPVVIKLWSKCNDINKINMMTEYVNIVREAFDLTDEQVLQLQTTIRSGMICKIVRVSEITDNRITNISGLQWDEETKVFYYVNTREISNERFFTKKPKAPVSKKEKLTSYESKWVNQILKR